MKHFIGFILAGCLAVSASEINIVSEPAHLIVSSDAKTSEIVFTPKINGQAMTRTALVIHEIQQDGSCKTLSPRTDADGKVVCRLSPKQLPHSIIASIPGKIAAEVCIETIPPAEWQRNAEMAKRIKLDKNLRILFLGDSLSDFSRGENFADKLNFWLNLYNPGKASFRNAGIGGDYITRMWQRMEGIDGPQKALRQEMYAGLESEKPDLVFIFLGHNDTKTNSTDGHTTPTVTPEVQEKTYRDMIAFIQKRIGGKIILVSSSSSNYELCMINAEKREKAIPGKPCSRFGEPKHMEAFNDVLKKLADELKLAYIDVYEPMKSQVDKALLLSPQDGVHLSEKGHGFIAAEFLKYMASQPSFTSIP